MNFFVIQEENVPFIQDNDISLDQQKTLNCIKIAVLKNFKDKL